jgi:hypothetical protein
MTVKSGEPSWQLIKLLFTAFLACTWLLPNHTEPWKVFLSEAWISSALLLAAGLVLFRRNYVSLTVPVLFLAMLALIPWIQHLAGLLPWAGQATIASAYLLAAALAWTLGDVVQQTSSTQLGDIVFGAFGIAGVASTGLALYQWLGVADPSTMDIWVTGGSYSGRATGNLGQPNQLGSLMVLGVLAAVWAGWRLRIGTLVAWGMAAFCMVGVVLTQSRTAVLELALLVGAAWYWRDRFVARRLSWQASLTFMVFLISFANIQGFESLLSLPAQSSLLDRVHTEVRPMQWLMFFDGLRHSPWWGYGWNLVTPAQFAADYYPAQLFGFNFGQSHNIFLDMMLWTGIPLGLLISTVLVCWYWRRFRRLKNRQQLIYFMAISVLALHSLVEYPLHYIYFLVPFAALCGALGSTQKSTAVIRISRVSAGALWLGGCLLWCLLLADSFAIERRYLSLRLKLAGVENPHPQTEIPQIHLMDQMAFMIEYAGRDVHADVSEEELETMRQLARFYASPKNILAYAASLGLHGELAQSQAWLDKACRVVSAEHCQAIPIRWAAYQAQFPVLWAVHAR